MTATTATWAIPYAQSTDPLCDGWEITKAMADRVDDILAEFDVDLAATEVIPIARASQLDLQAAGTVGVQFTAADFDTANLVNLAEPTKPITITKDTIWMVGGYHLWDAPTTGGTWSFQIQGTVTSNTINGFYQMRLGAVNNEDAYGSFITIGYITNLGGPVERLTVQWVNSRRSIVTYMWVFRIADRP